ncbi:MAG: sugar dehydrogenase complex small subunit [Phaeospirillum sp.]|nr:sugar dehydrogenase complex small subunit [Phaeospirillum sp.]
MSDDQRTTATASRRTIIKAMAAAAVAACLPGKARAASERISVDAFLAASSKLSGIALDKSYSQLGETLWHLLTLDGASRLRAMVVLVNHTPEERLERELRRFGLRTTAEKLLSTWYQGTISIAPRYFRDPVVLRVLGDLSGQVDPRKPHRAIPAVITYDEALAWRSCTFTKPSATCGGPFGYWQNPPT